jgi:hypothetical protein
MNIDAVVAETYTWNMDFLDERRQARLVYF